MLEKQSANINFALGLDQKKDPFQIPLGKFERLVNSVFNKVGRLTKRNGFGLLKVLDDTYSYLTTFRGSLTAIGEQVAALSKGINEWVEEGFYKSVDLGVTSIVRSNSNVIQCDSVTAPNGLVCVVFTETPNYVSEYYFYSIYDTVTGQILVKPTYITPSSGNVADIIGQPRVFWANNRFLVSFVADIGGAEHLQVLPISSATLAEGTAFDITTSYESSDRVAYDGVVANNSLYFAWNGASTSGIKMAYVNAALTVSSTVIVDAAHQAESIGVWADDTQPTPIIWVGYCDPTNTATWILARSSTLASILAATGNGTDGINVTGWAQNGVSTLVVEYSNPWTFDTTIPNSFVFMSDVTQAGVISNARSVKNMGLASKGFIIDGVGYVGICSGTPYQPTYFVVDEEKHVVCKVAYQNGGGFLTRGLPAATVLNDNEISFPYLFKAIIQAAGKSNALATGSQPLNVYAQLGVNLANLIFTQEPIVSTEAGRNLSVSGGFLWAYDGDTPNENNFHLWPELVLSADGTYSGIAATTTSNAFTGDTTDESDLITAMSATANILPGMTVTGVGIPAGTIVLALVPDPTSPGDLAVKISQPATATGAGVALTIAGAVAEDVYYYQFVYQWSDAQGNVIQSAPSVPVTIDTTGTATAVVTIKVPALTITYKIDNPVKIVGYRWSDSQQSYYQFTTVALPFLNDPSQQTITLVDASSDATIAGNNLIYTTGGVLENTGAPATTALTLFDDRVWLIDAEDENLLWYSKKLVNGVPVEMSDLLTYFVAPTVGGQGSTGGNKCLAAMDDKLIIFKENAIYYVNGTGPDNTGANSQYSQPVFVTGSVGCSNQKSITMIPSGLIFRSDKGFWLLGRDLSTRYIGADVDDYNEFTVTSATNVPETNQVRFSLSDGTMLMYDYFVEQWGILEGASSVSSTIYQELHTLINQYGQVLRETPLRYLDYTTPTLLSLKTGWINLAGLQGYQRAYFFYLLGQYLTPHKLLVSVAYDYNPSPEQSSLITPTNYSPPYGGPTPNPGTGLDSADPYGQESLYGGETNVEQWRIFLKKQRCQSIQITIQEVYDPSFGVSAGAGLTLSGINLVWGYKKSFRPISSAHSIGGGTK